MRSYERAKKAINEYLGIEELQEDQLYISIQLDKEDDGSFSIDYYIEGQEESDMEFIAPKFRFEDEEKAWKEYLNHLSEINGEYPEATKFTADPDLYKPVDSLEGINEYPVAGSGAVMYDSQDKNKRYVDSKLAIDTREWV